MWKKMELEDIKKRVFGAIDQNVNFYHDDILGVPASHLDSKVFYQDEPFLKNAPFLATMVHNPNHIGCHTLDKSESFFQGTQAIEREVIKLCSEDILKCAENECDGYVASGGTEANLQAIWIYRNCFLREHVAKHDEIHLLGSEDCHYSMPKAANLLNISWSPIGVEGESRVWTRQSAEKAVDEAIAQGKKYFICVANMMTTMFGSVDEIDVLTEVLEDRKVPFFMHVDGAYGGFFYPFAQPQSRLDFRNTHVSSITLDAHKMVQAPYGTGIFLIRKGMMKYAMTEEASYVEGQDSTVIGSRSGANAISIWMILMMYGYYGWQEKINTLHQRAQWLSQYLDRFGIRHFRNPFSNIVTIHADHLSAEFAHRFGLVPDNHHQPEWYKIVVMEHVTLERLDAFVAALEKEIGS
ncbi:MAG: aspartate aminotransferase family protein [Flavobacteriales bacterium]|nr:aspartate aminotransferase family protein [Flavobacteriales bacterium]